MQKSPSENLSTEDRSVIPMARRAVLIFVAFFQVNLSRAVTYLRDMRILACENAENAENAVRERLKNAPSQFRKLRFG